MSNDAYMLLSDAEKMRLQLQARVWEPETERLLDLIELQAGWSCLDIGCGAMGILGPLSRRVGSAGRVIGLEMETVLLNAARQYITDEELKNVELKHGNAYESGLEPEAFDLVHERFVLPHVTDPPALIQEMIRLAKPGAVVIVQEPDHSSWNFWPRCEEWIKLLPILESTLALRGDINIGRRAFQLMQQAGLQNVTIRAAVVALQNQHPYMKMPLMAAAAMRSVMLSASLTTEQELDALSSAVEQHIARSDTMMITFTTIQVWGQKPSA